MTSADRLIQLLFEAVTYSITPDETEAYSEPPHPLPAVLESFYDAAKEVLQQRLTDGGENPLCSIRLYEAAGYFTNEVRNWLYGADLQVSDPICLLLAGGLVSVEIVRQAIEVCADLLAPSWMQRAIVYRLCAKGQLDAAMQAADSEVFGEEKWVGWRAVGDYLAHEGDAAAFLKLWPKYKAVHQRHIIDGMRRDLIEAVSHRYGWREAVELSRDKRMSPKSHLNGLAYVALRPVAETGDVKALDRLLSTEELPGLDELARLQLLIDAMQASYPKADESGSDADHPDLSWVLPRIEAIDPSVSKERSRRRDWLLCDLWPVIADPATLKRVRSAVRAPLYRKELRELKGR